MTLKDYERKRRELWDEYQRKCHALDMVWEMFKKDHTPQPQPVVIREVRGLATPSVFDVTNRLLGAEGSFEISPVGTTQPRWGDFRNAIRAAVSKLQHRFTLRDVRQQLDKDDPAISRQIKNTTLSSALVRLERRGEIGVITRGRGKAATIYLRKDNLLEVFARA